MGEELQVLEARHIIVKKAVQAEEDTKEELQHALEELQKARDKAEAALRMERQRREESQKSLTDVTEAFNTSEQRASDMREVLERRLAQALAELEEAHASNSCWRNATSWKNPR